MTFNAFAEMVRDIQLKRYAQSSSIVIIFDHTITLGEEVELIWQSRWTLGKVLFLLNRYYSLGGTIFNTYALFAPVHDDSVIVSAEIALNMFFRHLMIVQRSRIFSDSCLSFFRWQGWTGLISCLFAEAILQMRLYALYSLDKKVLTFMLMCWIGCLTSSAYVMYTVLAKITVDIVWIPGGTTCLPHNISSHFYAFWIPMLSFEFLLCLLAVLRGFQTYKLDGSFCHSSMQIIKILIRDSIVYFLVIGATYLTCLLVWVIASVSLLAVPIGFALAMSCVLANRIVLNVRAINRDLGGSNPPSIDVKHSQVYGPGALTAYAMEELRIMQAERPFGDVMELYGLEELPFTAL